EYPPLAAGSNLAPQNQRAILSVQTIGLEDPFDRTRLRSVALKHRRDHGPLRTRADHIGGRLFPQQQSQRVDQNGLPRPGLAGQKIQTRGEFDHDIVDHRVIFKSKLDQHKGPTIFKYRSLSVARTPSSAAFELYIQRSVIYAQKHARHSVN